MKVVLTAAEAFDRTIKDVFFKDDCNDFNNIYDDFNDDTVNIKFEELNRRTLSLNEKCLVLYWISLHTKYT